MNSLAELPRGTRRTFYSVHPFVVASKLMRKLLSITHHEVHSGPSVVEFARAVCTRGSAY